MVGVLAILSGISGKKNDDCEIPSGKYLQTGGDVWGESVDSGGDEFAVADAGSRGALSTVESAVGVDAVDAGRI